MPGIQSDDGIRITALSADIGAALAHINELSLALKECVEAIVRHLDAAFARIWTLSSTGAVLELKASAGIYTHLNGNHSQVPVGLFKIGQIAKERKPHLTNDVAHDPRISDPRWAAREGMVAFAGYPLIVDDQLVGVLALFSRHPLSEATMTALESVSVGIAIGIERKRAQAALLDSERRYRFLAESMPQIVWTATPDGGLDYVSSQGTTYFGIQGENLLGAGWLAAVHPDDRDRVVNRWQQSLSSGEIYESEFRLRRGTDRAWRWFLVRAQPMFGPEHQTLSWVGTCTDTHEQKEGAEALRIANRELEEFAYVASHDLQEPLRMVNIYTQLLLRRITIDEPSTNQYADFVREGVRRMEELLRDLLSFSRSVHEADTDGTADLSISLNDAIAVLRTRIEETGTEIKCQFLPITRGDTRQIAHVFQNLLSNSLKYRRDEPPVIDISAEQQNDAWVVSVRDNGIGFETRYADRIFGLFKRLHKEEYPGTGLGLAICKRIIERYGGRMWAESTPGVGSTFFFSLPQGEEAQA